MSRLERQQQILEILNSLGENESISPKEIAAKIYSSESSVRRDLNILAEKHLITQIYGGVMLSRYRNSVIPIGVRETLNAGTKDYLAALGAELVNDNDVIFLDSSSTARRVMHYLSGKKNIRVITNNQRIFNEYSGGDISLYCTGGKWNSQCQSYSGDDTISYILSKNADILFFSGQGLSLHGDITDIWEEETAVRKAMIKKSKRQVFLCDSSKIGVEKFTTLCNIRTITDIICDKPEMIDEIRKKL